MSSAFLALQQRSSVISEEATLPTQNNFLPSPISNCDSPNISPEYRDLYYLSSLYSTLCHVYLGHPHRSEVVSVVILVILIPQLSLLSRFIIIIKYPLPTHRLRSHLRPRCLLIPRHRRPARSVSTPPSRRPEPRHPRLPDPRRIHPLRPPRFPVRAALAWLVRRSLLRYRRDVSVRSHNGRDVGNDRGASKVPSVGATEAEVE